MRSALIGIASFERCYVWRAWMKQSARQSGDSTSKTIGERLAIAKAWAGI